MRSVFQLVLEWVHSVKDLIPECDLCFMFKMSQTLNTVPNFDGLNYGYWKS